MKKLFAVLAALAAFFIAQNSWAVCANYTTYADGQVLTAASLNSLQTNYTNCTNNVLDGDNFTGTMNWYSGVDAAGYSDAGTTKTWEMESAGGVATAKSISAPCIYFEGGYACNCSLSYSSPTITISGAAAALSATNKCVIGMNNASAKPAAFEITADVTTTDGNASDTDENLFGVTTGVAWGSAMPLFLHYCDGNGADYFGFSRNPARIETGNAATDMCQEGDIDCDAQGDLFIMTSGLTLANEVDRPCLTVGSFQATMSAGNDWTVEAITAGRDGFGKFQEGVLFTMPAGQNGCADSAEVYDAAGVASALDFDTLSEATYMITRDGFVTVWHNHLTQSANGAALTAVNWYLPYTMSGVTNEWALGKAFGKFSNAIIARMTALLTATTSYMQVYFNDTSTVNDNAFANTNDYIHIQIGYKAF